MAQPERISYLMLLVFLCGMAPPAWGRPKPRPASLAKVALRDLEPYRQFYLATHRDTLVNCDSTADLRALYRTGHGPVFEDGGKKLPGASVDAFAVGDSTVARWTYLKAAGDSIFVMATLASRAGGEFYAGFCIEAADVASLYVQQAAEDRGPARGHGRPGRGRHGPGGGGFFAGALTVLAVVAVIVLLSSLP